jgi:hypothetical protein
MPRFSRGIRPETYRDLQRILDPCPQAEQRWELAQAAERLLEALAEDPHEKGEARPQTWNPWLRVLQDGPIRLYYWVGQPPLEDLYVEAVGFSRG